MTDVVSQLEATIAEIEQRHGHRTNCNSLCPVSSYEYPAYIGHNCTCDRAARVRGEIARVWLASLEAMSESWPEGDNNDGALPLSYEQRLAAAFRATQEQETKT